MALKSEHERRFASWLRRNSLAYEYEKVVFSSRNGASYTPDFYIEVKKAVIEVKPVQLLYEINDWKRHIIEHNLHNYGDIFFVIGMPGNNPDVLKAFDRFRGWVDDRKQAKTLFEKLFELSKPLPGPKSLPNANPRRTFLRPTTPEEKDQIVL